MESTTQTHASFIEHLSLEMTLINISESNKENIVRAAEMSHRVTQFNLSGNRYTEPELIQFLTDSEKIYQIIQIHLKDRFGDYGVIATSIFHLENTQSQLVIDDVYVSCRAFYRGVEHYLFRSIGVVAKKEKKKNVLVILKETARNKPIRFFMEQFNHRIIVQDAHHLGETRFMLETTDLLDIIFTPHYKITTEPNTMTENTNSTYHLTSEHVEIIYENFSTILNYTNFLKKINQNIQEVSNSSVISSIWKSKLNLQCVPSQNSHFFENGGTSIQAVELLSQLYETTKIEISLPSFLKNPTLKNLIERCGEQITSLSLNPTLEIGQQKNDLIFPATPNQKWLWLNKQIDGHSWHYNTPFIFEVGGVISESVFQKSLQDTVSQLSALRTIFFENKTTDELYQKILQSSVPKIDVINVEGYSEERISQLISQKSKEEFDFIYTPPYQITILKHHVEKWILIINVHHIIFDAESYKIFIAKLSAAYNIFLHSPSRTIMVPILPMEYFAKDPTIITFQLDYWNNKLKNLPSLKLPYNYPRPLENKHNGQYIDFVINTTQGNKIKQLAKHNKVSLQSVILSALFILLREYGNEDICIPISISGRSQMNISTVGFFSNILPIRLQPVNQNIDIDTLLALYHDTVTEAYQFSDVPFYQMINQLDFERKGSHNLFNQILLSVFDQTYTQVPKFGTVKNKHYQYGYNAARADLVIEVMPDVSGELRIGFYYASALFNRDSILDFSEKLRILIVQFVMGTRLFKLNHLKVYGRTFGCTKVIEKSKLHEYFDNQVKETPNNIALRYNNNSLSYAELNEEINQISQLIIKKIKVSKQYLIIYLPRDNSLIASYFVALKCGVTFIPIDHLAPQGWIKTILGELGSASYIVITNSILSEKISFIDHQKLLCIDQNTTTVKDFSDQSHQNESAYILFTSGSTGKPKGVKVSHKNALNLIEWGLHQYSKDELTNVLFATSVNFDLSIFEIFVTLASGGTIHIVENILALIDTPIVPITLINTVPTVIQTLYKLNAIPKTTKVINLAGEALNHNIVNNLYKLPHIKKVYNLYAPTETTTFSTCKLLSRRELQINVGYPIYNTAIHIVNDALAEVMVNVEGEIAIAGHCVSQGYIANEQNLDKFIENGLSPELSKTLYLTGDRGYVNSNKELYILGRKDEQIKINGHRIDLPQIENNILAYQSVFNAVVIARKDSISKNLTLSAFIIPTTWPDCEQTYIIALKEFLKENWPHYMIPTYYKLLKVFPQLISGKIDRLAFNTIKLNAIQDFFGKKVSDDITAFIIDTWEKILGHSNFSTQNNFFDVGGDSILAAQLYGQLKAKISQSFRLIDIFIHPSIDTFKLFLDSEQNKHLQKHKASTQIYGVDNNIAIIGAALRFPAANNLEEYWEIIKTGKVVVKQFDLTELNMLKVPDSKKQKNNFVPISGLIKDIGDFDYTFFDYTLNDALEIDPQQRVFLEIVWEALENAGCIPEKTDYTIGVFAGSGPNYYQARKSQSQEDSVQHMKWMLANEKDYLATRVAYKLNLTGPAININTSCSTSLVAISTACQYLQSGLIDIGIAGGVSLILPENAGYIYEPNHIFSKNGICNPFDSEASGTIPSSGAGVVILKNLSRALSDGDNILAIIKGIAVNNDGNMKVSFTAPSATSQAACITRALEMSKLDSSMISYIEAHGTGTNIGDPIEMEGITTAYSSATNCTIGTVKANIGHTDASAGIAGLLKVIAMLKNRQLPPQPHFQNLNEKINLNNGSFRINTQLQEWQSEQVRYAGISSFGIGGTNVHMIVQEALAKQNLLATTQQNQPAFLILSAKTEFSLKMMRNKLAAHLKTLIKGKNEINLLHCIAYTLIHHRAEFKYQFACECHNIKEAIHHLESPVDTFSSIEKKLMYLESIYPKGSYSRINLPTYVFDKKTLYIPASTPQSAKLEINHSYKINKKTLSLLTDICMDLLGVTKIKPTDDFFALGGDSLLLLRLLSSIKKVWGLELNFDEVFNCDSLSKTAELIDSKQSTYTSTIQLKLLREGDNKNLIVFIHPGNGALFQYQTLVKNSKVSNAIYGISNTLLDPNSTEFQSIEDYALKYLDCIKAKFSKSNIVLVGWSFGGTVAYEMTRLSQKEMPQNIKNTLLLDSWAHYPPSFNQDKTFKDVVKHSSLPQKQTQLLLSILQRRMQLLSSYHPKPIKTTTQISLFKASADSMLSNVTFNYWDQYVENLDVFSISGNHNTLLMEKNIAILLNYFDKLVKEATHYE